MFINICGLPADGEGVSRLFVLEVEPREFHGVFSIYIQPGIFFNPPEATGGKQGPFRGGGPQAPSGEHGDGHPACLQLGLCSRWASSCDVLEA